MQISKDSYISSKRKLSFFVRDLLCCEILIKVNDSVRDIGREKYDFVPYRDVIDFGGLRDIVESKIIYEMGEFYEDI